MLSTKQVGYSKEDNQFHEEISTLEANGSVVKIGSAYSGFEDAVVVKSKNGEDVYYRKTTTFTDGEGDITHWLFAPTVQSMNRVPACCGTTFKVWND